MTTIYKPIVIVCSECNKQKPRVTKRENTKVNYYSLAGKPWKNKSVCSECTVRLRAVNEREKQAAYKAELSSCDLVKEYHAYRVCNICKGKLLKSRWFTCIDCKPQLDSILEDWMYELA